MIERRQDLGFAGEPGQALRVERDRLRQHLDGDVSLQRAVARAIHLAHPTDAEETDDDVWADQSAGGQEHEGG